MSNLNLKMNWPTWSIFIGLSVWAILVLIAMVLVLS